MHANTNNVANLQKRLNGFRKANTGLKYEVLADFSEPLFEMYQVDPEWVRCDPEKIRQDEALALTVSALGAGRIIWAYLALGREDRQECLSDLVDYLLGDNATHGDWKDLLKLLQIMEDRWNQLQRVHARHANGIQPLTFFELIDHFRSELDHPPLHGAANMRFGPDQILPPDAMALFARPLLESPEVLRDPELFEAALGRADDYWELSLADPSEFPAKLALIKQKHGGDHFDTRRIEKEARQMVARFCELFPEKAKWRTGR